MEWSPADRSASQTYRFLTSAVAPRPIAWITTVDRAGLVNCAPFSWFNSVCADPPMVMVAIGSRPDLSPKDTARNIRDTGEFVVNAAPAHLAAQMVASSAEHPPEVSEVAVGGLATVPSRLVAPPRLAGSPVHLECRLRQIIQVGRRDDHRILLGEIVHFAANDDVLDAHGNLDPTKATLVGRLGGARYVDTSRPFEIPWPDQPPRAPSPVSVAKG